MTRRIGEIAYFVMTSGLLLVTFIVIVPILGLWALVNGDAAAWVRRAIGVER